MSGDLPQQGVLMFQLLVAEVTNKPHVGISLFQEVFVPLCSLFALRAILRTWSGRMSRSTGALGILLWGGAAVAIALPDLTSGLASRVGIDRGADLVLYLAILCGMAVSFYFYQRTRQTENLITALVRREAVRAAKLGESSVKNR